LACTRLERFHSPGLLVSTLEIRALCAPHSFAEINALEHPTQRRWNAPAIVTGAGAAASGAATRDGSGCARPSRPPCSCADPGAAAGIADKVRARGVACRVESCDGRRLRQRPRRRRTQRLTRGAVSTLLSTTPETVEPMGFIADHRPGRNGGRAFAVNVVGAYHVVREALPLLLREGGAVLKPVDRRRAHTARRLVGLLRHQGRPGPCSRAASPRNTATRACSPIACRPGMVDTEMQVRIRRAGINEISRIPREQLDPPERSANVIAWLAAERPAELCRAGSACQPPGVCRTSRSAGWIAGMRQ